MGIGCIWFNLASHILCTGLILIGVFTYAYSIKNIFALFYEGGSDRFLGLLDKEERNEEFFALESLYSLVKPISIRLPDEVSTYKLAKIHKREKEIESSIAEEEG